MMQAFPQTLALLPGTFETVGGSLRRMAFDLAILSSVTEHFDRLHLIFRGLWETLGGCSTAARIYIDHHNYYGFTGHHGYGKSASEAKKAPPHMRELLDWGHLNENASQASSPSLNRVRPGDLSALLDVYFNCTCYISVKVKEDARARLTEAFKANLHSRGFTDSELFAEHIIYECGRREHVVPDAEAALESLVFHHPRMDGSYSPRAFTCKGRHGFASARQQAAPRGACKVEVAELKSELGHVGEGECAFDF